MMHQKEPISVQIKKFLINWVDNPITTSLVFALWTIPIYFHLLPYFSYLQTPENNDYENIKQFIEWFGVPYGLLLALVMVNAWTQFETAKRALDREADALMAFYNTVELISGKHKIQADKIKTEVKKYVKNVLEHYTEESSEDTGKWKCRGDDSLDAMRIIIGTLIRQKESDVITAELLRFINELVDDRGDRLDASKERMPKSILAISIIASFLWLAPFLFLKFDNPSLGILFVGGVTLIVVSLLLIIVDLDNPIDGTWSMEMESWKELSDKIN
jgi:hypothetical protein